MDALTTIDVLPNQILERQLVSSEIANEIASTRTEPEAAGQLPQLLRRRYPWYDDTNRQHALDLFPGVKIAYQRNLFTQIELYKQRLLQIVTKDMAERAGALINQRTQYQSSCHEIEPNQSQGQSTFEVPISSRGSRETVWIYSRLHNFAQFIPPHALQALTVLDDAGFSPDEFWVADKVEREVRRSVASSSRSLDPVLMAQIGRYFVALSEWE